MENFIQKIKQFVSRIVFDADRKAAIREQITGFMRAHQTVRGRTVDRLIPQRSFSSFKLKFMPIFATFLLVALLGGGTSFAAQDALPGDALYGVKVGINEEVRASLTFGTQAKAEWEAERLSRRLEEKAALAARAEEPSPKAAAQLEELFDKHAEKIEARLAELEAAGKTEAATDVAVKVEAALAAYAQKKEGGIAIMSATAAGASLAAPSARLAFEEKVDAALDKMTEVRAELEAKTIAEKSAPEIKAAAEGKIKAAENVITSASRYVEKWEAKSESGASFSTDAEAKLKAAEEISAEAKAKLDTGEYAEAFKLANEALKTSHEAKFDARTEIIKAKTVPQQSPMPVPPDKDKPESSPEICDASIKTARHKQTGEIKEFGGCVPEGWEVLVLEAPLDKDKPAPPEPKPGEPDRRLRICPDEWIEDRMPTVIGPDIKGGLPREYFILNGSRREITEFDTNWVWGNCKIEKQIVY